MYHILFHNNNDNHCNIWFSKVHIFWEGHKILRHLPLTFESTYVLYLKVRGRFRKIVWPSQSIWTLSDLKILKMCFQMFLPVGNPVKWFELLNAWSDAEWRLTLPLRPSSPYRSNVALQEHATGKGFSFGLEIYFLALLFVVKKGRKYLGESVICTPNTGCSNSIWAKLNTY